MCVYLKSVVYHIPMCIYTPGIRMYDMCMHVSMYVCMDGWTDGWTDGWKDGRMDGCGSTFARVCPVWLKLRPNQGSTGSDGEQVERVDVEHAS